MAYEPQVSGDLQKKNAQSSRATNTIAICKAYLRSSLANFPLSLTGESGLSVEFAEAMGYIPPYRSFG